MSDSMSDFTFASDGIDLPKGAWARAHRQRLRHGGRTVMALTQGLVRNYAYPLCTPAGYCVTSEAPADHPHHQSLWIGADHVHVQTPAVAGTIEEYTYNFYVNETFQGRAAGRIVERACSAAMLPDGSFEIVQELEWRGPPEWAADEGRLVALERRAYRIETGERRNRIEVSSRLSADERAVRLGPTRHAYFNARVADTMIVANGGAIRDDLGREGGAAVSGEGARWVDFSGPIGGGARAGVTVIPHALPRRRPFWFVADWGVVTVGPFRGEALALEPGRPFQSSYTVLVHDGDADIAEAEAIAGRQED
jgi:hypothetical protein